VAALSRWFRFYKSPRVNTLAFGGEAIGRAYTERLIGETHRHWEQLVARGMEEERA
jgi:hypothetical protein